MTNMQHFSGFTPCVVYNPISHYRDGPVSYRECTICTHSGDGFTWWRHQMETFSALLAICAGNSPVTGIFPAAQSQWRRALIYSLICARINGWVDNGEPGDLRRHRAHNDVTVMGPTCKVTWKAKFRHVWQLHVRDMVIYKFIAEQYHMKSKRNVSILNTFYV